MKSSQLSDEEREILASYDAGEFRSDLSPARKVLLEQSAAGAIEEDKEINITIPERDFDALQRRAFEAGLSYQALLASIVHRYVSGSLYDAAANTPRRHGARNHKKW